MKRAKEVKGSDSKKGSKTVAAETVAKKAGAEDRDAKIIGTIAGVGATIIKAIAEY